MKQFFGWMGRHAGKIALAALPLLGIALIAPGFVLPRMSRMPEKKTERQLQRVEHGMRELGLELEEWKRKNGSYPEMKAIEPDEYLAAEDLGEKRIAGLSIAKGPDPIMHGDEFAARGLVPFAYHTDGKRWLLMSAGPDGIHEFHPERLAPARALDRAARVDYTYDPTNGVFSSGDIFRASEAIVERPS